MATATPSVPRSRRAGFLRGGKLCPPVSINAYDRTAWVSGLRLATLSRERQTAHTRGPREPAVARSVARSSGPSARSSARTRGLTRSYSSPSALSWHFFRLFMTGLEIFLQSAGALARSLQCTYKANGTTPVRREPNRTTRAPRGARRPSR
jgi:hypothetical protein